MNIRALKILVSVMGVMIIVGVVVILVTIVNRIQAKVTVAKDTPAAVFGSIDVPVPAGTRLLGASGDGETLLLQVEDTAGQRVIVIDLGTGSARGAVRLVPMP